MSAQHTPGPWFVSGQIDARYLNGVGDVVLIRRLEATDNRYVAAASLDAMGSGHPATSPAEREANAHLIAAAPELLAALQCALFDLEHTYAHASIGSADRIKHETFPLCRAAIAKATGAQS